jgi:hypothetical protein
MSKEVFYDKSFNEHLLTYGYIKVPFLTSEEVARLQDFYKQLHNSKVACVTTFMDDEFDYKLMIDQEIKRVFQPAVQKFFTRHIGFWGNFFTKHPGTCRMPLHADLQYIDETQDVSINIWVPLSCTDSENGTLGIVPASHKLMNQIRGINITAAYKKYAEEIADELVCYLAFNPGEAIIYDHRLLHLSSANHSHEPRVAAALSLVPCDQSVQMYFAENEGDTTFYLFQFDNIENLIKTPFKKVPSHLHPIKTISDYKFIPIRKEDILTLNNGAAS